MATYIWQRRGRVTVVMFAIVAVIGFYLQQRLMPSARATSGASPYVVPQVVDTNGAADIVETTITAQSATVDIGGGQMANVLTYNGSIPGPEFRLNVNDTVIVHFVNNLAHKTGIHWHGIELANASDGTPLTQNMVDEIGSGTNTFTYKFKVTRPGIYWYHPHHHSSTNQVFKGLYGTIIVKDPNEDALVADGRIPGPAQTLTMALSDITVCKAVGNNDLRRFPASAPWAGGSPLPDQTTTPKEQCEAPTAIDEDGNLRPSFAVNDVPNIQKSGNSGTVNEGQVVLTNGKNVGGRAGTPLQPGALSGGAETYTVQQGQGIRLQVLNVATTRFFRLRLTTNGGQMVPLVKIGGEGGILDDSVMEGNVIGPPAPSDFIFRFEKGEFVLDPGDRLDLVAAIPADATGTLTLWTQDFARTGPSNTFAKTPTVPVAHFAVSGSANPTYTIGPGVGLRSFTGNFVEVLGAATATFRNPAGFNPPKNGMTDEKIELSRTSVLADGDADDAPVGNTLGINAFQGAHDVSGDYTLIPRPHSTRWARVGDRLQLQVSNVTDAHHPFHLHGFSIQPISMTNGETGNATIDATYGTTPKRTRVYPHEFVDNLDIPPGYTLTFRTRIDDRKMMDGVTDGGALGRWVLHCHIFFHATFGMIGELDVLPFKFEFVIPQIKLIKKFEFINPGDPVEIVGNYFHEDGLAVRMFASKEGGKFEFDGRGGFKWTYFARRGDSGPIYFTAIDAAGNKNQTAFSLQVNQQAPPRAPVCPPASMIEISADATHSYQNLPVGGAITFDGSPLSIRVLNVLMDEQSQYLGAFPSPAQLVGGGIGQSDGNGFASGLVMLRSERNGTRQAPGNGRVYHVLYEGSDAAGQSCQGESIIGVRFAATVAPVDDGAVFPALPAASNPQ